MIMLLGYAQKKAQSQDQIGFVLKLKIKGLLFLSLFLFRVQRFFFQLRSCQEKAPSYKAQELRVWFLFSCEEQTWCGLQLFQAREPEQSKRLPDRSET